MDVADLFWSRVDRRGADDCWPWKLGLDSNGYGRMRVGGKLERAHRIAFWCANGRWPTEARHRCDNPTCANPGHVEDGTHGDNMQDRERRGRTSRGERHPGAKLTAADVREARILRAEGWLWRALAVRYSVSLPTINAACCGRRWRHVVAI